MAILIITSITFWIPWNLILEDNKDSRAYLESFTFCCLRESLKADLSVIKLFKFKTPRKKKKENFTEQTKEFII